MKHILYLPTCTVPSASVVVSSYAGSDRKNDALAVAATKISLSQAVVAAEQHVAGKASRAELKKHDDQWFYDVEVVNGKKVMGVRINLESGKVLTAPEDKVDEDNQDHDQFD